MAKKKTKAPQRLAAKKKTTPKVSKKSRKVTTSKKRKTSVKKKESNSVDEILRKFEKERSSLDVHLAALEKKISGLEVKTKAFQEQLVKLAQDKESTLDSIAQIGARRDIEVSEMLSKLGIKLQEIGGPSLVVESAAAESPEQSDVPEGGQDDWQSDSESQDGDSNHDQ